jgi:hypothetical protein
MLDSSKDYQSAIYAPSRRIDARITFTQGGTSNVYDDNYITQITLAEEMSTLNDSISSDELQVTLDNTDGIFDFLNFSNMNQIIAQRPSIQLEFGLEIPTTQATWSSIQNLKWSDLSTTWSDVPFDETVTTTEWIVMGTYYLDAWKSDVGAVTVTLIAHDNFTMLDNISYGSPGYMANRTLYDIAVDVFNTVGITNYNIDTSLQNYTTTTGFKESVTARVALQHVGIAGMAAVYQDRNGVMQIKPFSSIDSGGTIALIRVQVFIADSIHMILPFIHKLMMVTGCGRLDLNNMWTVPEISLDKSIYQVSVNVYSSNDVSSPRITNNTSIAGQNGESFTIDNPLINTSDRADKVANWFIQESNFNVVYKSNWRGNPILENGDICIISNGIDLTYSKNARLYKTEWQYAGYLSCQTEARGGI